MRARNRVMLLLGALIAMTAATTLVARVGLPDRVTFSDGQLPTAPQIGALAPSFVLQSLNNTDIDLETLRGLPLVVNFWATWCAPCRIEMPELQALYEAHRESGLRIVAVNVGESRQEVERWTRSLGLTFDIALDETAEVAALYQLRGQPSTFVISPSGLIVDIFYGSTTRSALEAALRF